ncbi:MAG: hypothetical protein EON55_15670, partial [Alphaproteobacteria bacterium]
MTHRHLFLAGLGTILLAGCAPTPVPPGLDAEVLRVNGLAQSGAVPADSISLMRRQGELYARHPFVAGNRVDLLVDCPATFAAMRDIIEHAQIRIDM